VAARAKLPVELESWKNAKLRCLQSDKDFAERLTKGSVWIAVYHNQSRRPLVIRIQKQELSEADHRTLWQAYDGEDTAEQEEVLVRIHRKQ
jgi:hypothetical protein